MTGFVNIFGNPLPEPDHLPPTEVTALFHVKRPAELQSVLQALQPFKYNVYSSSK